MAPLDPPDGPGATAPGGGFGGIDCCGAIATPVLGPMLPVRGTGLGAPPGADMP